MNIRKIVSNILKLLAIPVLMLVVMKLVFPSNITLDTVKNMIYQAVAPSILAWGACFNVKVGNRDFSVGASAMIAAIVGGNLALSMGLGYPGIFICTVLVGTLCGLTTGGLYLLLRVPTVIVSVGMVFMLESLSGIFMDGHGILLKNNDIVLDSFGPQMLVGLAVFTLSYYIYNYRPIGYHVRAIGNGMSVSTQKGINVFKVKFLSFVLAGLFAGIFGAVTLGTSGVYRASASSLSTMSIAFDAMMSVFIGQALGAFANLSVSIFVGSVALRILKLMMILIGFPASFYQIVVAIFVLMFMCISSYAEMKAEARTSKERIEEQDVINKTDEVIA